MKTFLTLLLILGLRAAVWASPKTYTVTETADYICIDPPTCITPNRMMVFGVTSTKFLTTFESDLTPFTHEVEIVYIDSSGESVWMRPSMEFPGVWEIPLSEFDPDPVYTAFLITEDGSTTIVVKIRGIYDMIEVMMRSGESQ